MNILSWYNLFLINLSRESFYEDLAEMYETGLNLRQFLELQIAIATKTKQDDLKEAYTRILRRFDSGTSEPTLQHLLSGVVNEVDMVTLEAIEEGGPARKHIGLRELAGAVKRRKAIVLLLAKSLWLPAFMLPTVGVLSYILADVILAVERSAPVYVREEIFKGFNEVVRVAASFTKDSGPFLLVGIIGLIVAFVMILMRWTGPMRLKADTFIGFSLYRDFQAAAFFSNLAPLLESGKKLLPALELLAAKSNRWTRWQVRRILSSLQEAPTEYERAFTLGICSPYVEGRLSTLVGMLREKEARGDYKLEFADVIVTLGKKEVGKSMERISESAFAINTVLVTVLFSYSSMLGLGSMTVPGKFAELMDPGQIQMLQQRHALKVQATAAIRGKGP